VTQSRRITFAASEGNPPEFVDGSSCFARAGSKRRYREAVIRRSINPKQEGDLGSGNGFLSRASYRRGHANGIGWALCVYLGAKSFLESLPFLLRAIAPTN